jgi:O-antigen/teichoic acid export membrane protein
MSRRIEEDPEEGEEVERAWLARDTFVNFGGAVVPGVISLLALPVLISLAGPRHFGFWLALAALAGAAAAVEFGLSSAVTRAVAASGGSTADPAAARTFLSSAFWFVAVIGAIGGIVVAILAFGIATAWNMSGSVPVVTLCLLTGSLVVLEHLTNFSTWILFGARRFAAAKIITGATSVARSLGGIAVLYMGLGITGLAAWIVFTAAAAALVAQVTVRRLAPAFAVDLRLARWASLRGEAGFSLGSQGIVVTTGLAVDTAPVLVIGAILGPAAIVVYQLGQRLAAVTGQLFIAAGSVLFTSACEAASDPVRMRAVLRVGTRWMVLLGVPVSIALLLIAPELVHAWLRQPSGEVVTVFRLLIVTRLLVALTEPSLDALWATAMSSVLRITIIVSAAQVALLWPLVSWMGVAGASLGVVLGVAVSGAVLFLSAARRFGMPFREWAGAAVQGIPVPLAASATLILAATHYLRLSGWLPVLSALALGMALFLATFYHRGATGGERQLAREVASIFASWLKGVPLFSRATARGPRTTGDD